MTAPKCVRLMEYFATGAGVEQWVKAGGAISPHQDSSLDWYTTDIDRGVAEAILNAEVVRFDASDLMPGEVGAGSFWKGDDRLDQRLHRPHDRTTRDRRVLAPAITSELRPPLRTNNQ